MPSLTISRRAADRLRAGYLWIYRTELAHVAETSSLPPGALVTIVDSRGTALGSALYSTTSQIAARLVSPYAGLERDAYIEDVRTRLHDALHLRWLLAPADEANTAGRLVFSEADSLPGIVIDRYNDLVLVQLLTQGTAQNDVRKAITDALRIALADAGQALTVWERADPRIRELEQLPAPPAAPLYTNAAPEDGLAPTRTTFALNGLRFSYDAAAGQKTGAFLDQRLNYAAAAAWVERSGRTGRALDICTYQGGFALHLAQVCASVTGVDASRAALQSADTNLALNAGLRGAVEWVEADAFDLLRALDEANQTTLSPGNRKPGKPSALPVEPGLFDTIVLDPPAFAKSKRAAEGALRGYKELNLRAMRLLAPGGTLVTCSCSHHVSLAMFTEVVAAAAADAGRRVQLLETRAAAPDHPEILTLPETRYLKCLIARVD